MTEGMIDLERVARRIAATRVPHNYTEAAFVEEYWRSFLPPARAATLNVIEQQIALAKEQANCTQDESKQILLWLCLWLDSRKSELEGDRP